MICGKFVTYKSNTAQPEADDEGEGESAGPLQDNEYYPPFQCFTLNQGPTTRF